MTFSPKYGLWLTIGGSLTVLFAAVFFGIVPILAQIENARETYIVQASEILLRARRAASFREFEKELGKLAGDIAAVEGALLDRNAVLEFIVGLEQLAQEVELQKDIAVVDETRSDRDRTPPSLLFRVNLFGSFPNVLAFLSRLEHGTFLNTVEELAIARLSESGDVQATLSVRVFLKP